MIKSRRLVRLLATACCATIFATSQIALPPAAASPTTITISDLSPLAPREVRLPSALPSGVPANDTIFLTFHPARVMTGVPAPAVILLHPLGLPRQMTGVARRLAEQGINAATVTLPFHGSRLPPGDSAARHFIGSNVEANIQAALQSAADTRTVLDWLETQPGVDASRFGVIGVSLGAIVAHGVMGEDPRLIAGVAALGGGDFPSLYRDSQLINPGPVIRTLLRRAASTLTADERQQLSAIDPLRYAERNRPRRVLMIQAARDQVVPPRNAEVLWEALGRPPIQWIDTNHFALQLAERSFARTSIAYLRSVWAGAPTTADELPQVRVPTIKAGTLFGLDSNITPAVQWQFRSFATRRDHKSLLHANAGWSGRGPFLSLATTVNDFVDLGLAHRLTGGKLRPYASLHLVY